VGSQTVAGHTGPTRDVSMGRVVPSPSATDPVIAGLPPHFLGVRFGMTLANLPDEGRSRPGDGQMMTGANRAACKPEPRGVAP
jgi:hypothetical protein